MNVCAVDALRRLGYSLVLGCLASSLSLAEVPKAQKQIIHLEPAPDSELRALDAQQVVRGEATFANPPANFRQFESAHVGDSTNTKTLTLRFSGSTKLTHLTSTPDFKIEQGSSCVEGDVYESGHTCTLVVRFAPQGAGRRLGRIKIEHTASVAPMYVGLGGNGYAPVISFTPSVMSTVPASYPSSKGLLSGAKNLSVDGGDTLYIADTGNNLIRSKDSSGTIKTVSSGTLSAPYSVVADNFGEVFFDEPAQNAIFEIFDYGSQVQFSGTNSDNCTTTTTCSIASEKIELPGTMSIDPNNSIFMVEQHRGAMVAYAQPYPAQIAYLYDPFTFQNANQGVVAVDAYDNIYSLWSIPNNCQIASQYFSDAANSHQVYRKVAGGKTCGFSGDGGPARNAEISANVTQIAFDVAGNLYFSDTGNQRVRRIDATTGNISTIAGTGSAGYGGDGGAATLSTLNNPTGVAVDSQGQVFIISTASGAAQVIRKVGLTGALPFSGQTTGTASAAQVVTLANTGNSPMTLTRAFISGGNASDFTIDPNTTTCLLTAGSTLANGQSCKVGVIFKPSGTGNRTSSLIFLDNTVTGTNTVSLFGPGVAPAKLAASVTLSSKTNPATSCSSIAFATAVSSTGAQPTGQVQLKNGSTVLVSATLSNGSATLTTPKLAAGTYSLTAVYGGDSTHNPSTSSAVAEVVKSASCGSIRSGPIKSTHDQTQGFKAQ
jgi:hypothetical protein